MGIKNINLNDVESTNNKQNDLSLDGTGVKYPTVDAVNDGNSKKLDKTFSQDEDLDLDGHKLTIKNGRTEEFFTERETVVRPIAKQITYQSSPSTPPLSFTDHHGLEIIQRASGANVNDKLSLYPAEFIARNDSSNKIGVMVGVYSLVENNPTGGGAIRIKSFQSLVRNRGNGVVNDAIGLDVYAPINTGSGSIENAIGVKIADITSGTNENYGVKSEANNFFRKIEVSDTGMVQNLNSEMLGGKKEERFLSGSNATKTTSSANANAINKTGLFTLSNSAVNTPYSGNWSIQSIQINNGLNYYTQTAINLEYGDLHVRSVSNGVYKPWEKVQLATSSDTTNRPTRIVTGQQHFDTTLGKPIWYDGTNWVDALGVIV